MKPRRSNPVIARAFTRGAGVSDGVRLGRAALSAIAVRAGDLPTVDALGRDVVPVGNSGLAAATTGQPKAGWLPWVARGAKRYVAAKLEALAEAEAVRAVEAQAALFVPGVFEAAELRAQQELRDAARVAYEQALAARVARPVDSLLAAQPGPVVLAPSARQEAARRSEAMAPLAVVLREATATRARLAWLLGLLAPPPTRRRAMPAGELDGAGQVRRRAVAPSAPTGTRGGYVPSLTDHLRGRVPRARVPLVSPTVPGLPERGACVPTAVVLCAPA